MSKTKDFINARESYIELIRADLMGPGSETTTDIDHELISSKPQDRYSVGILYPQEMESKDNDELEQNNDNNSEEIETDSLEIANEYTDIKADKKGSKYRKPIFEDCGLDEEVTMASQLKPSSMGITFIVKGDATKIKCNVKFATYHHTKLSELYVNYTPTDPDSFSLPEDFSPYLKYDHEKQRITFLSKLDSKTASKIFEKENVSSLQNIHEIRTVVYKCTDVCHESFVRDPHETECTIDFSSDSYVNSIGPLDGTTASLTALKTPINDCYSITIMMVNTCKDQFVEVDKYIFQPSVSVSTDNNDFVFIDSNKCKAISDNLDDEEKRLELLYRDKNIYATGLGVSTDWLINDDGTGKVWTDFMPEAEIPQMSFDLPDNPYLSNDKLSMKHLSDLDDTPKATKISELKALTRLYKEWIDKLSEIKASLEPNHLYAANRNIEECLKAYSRMIQGIEILENDDTAFDAFQLANRAMFMQRVHLRMQSTHNANGGDRYPGDEDIKSALENMDYNTESDNRCIWRPFQLAFMLMDIKGIVDPSCSDRDMVDLIWFPTGGGKTEAYLGLTAFTIFNRKMRYIGNSGGTAVIMRYTLRLLTSQQFSRAATLICACEYIRKDCSVSDSYPVGMPRRAMIKSKYKRYKMDNDPITIGLWIGNEHVPNRNKGSKERPGAKEYLDKLKKASFETHQLNSAKARNNKFQVLKCPWCGTKMTKDIVNKKAKGKWGYNTDQNDRFYMFCPHESCDYRSRLPIQIIDDELYKNPPTLLFGTVDKFAMMAWKGETGSFFASNSENRTPELIIQDELHLISGSLGTIVGLYETAVDAICGQKGVRPKIVASTATIRRAKEQCAVLYNREVMQFPPSGLNASDSFFAHEAPVDYSAKMYGRKYVGFMPSGKTKTTMEIRAIASLMQRIDSMELTEEIKDKYWTLAAYYNNLKDLGRASSLVNDDVRDAINFISKRLMIDRRIVTEADELTSRVPTVELNETLDKLEKREYKKGKIEYKDRPSDIVLATNMISVGIDIARLNVMLMIGQPKLTSEYIQASSRVGRSFPGVAFVQYDATKSRDRSYYEQFKGYHDAFYKYVEPTGATPFSKPACDRALHAIIYAILRNKLNLNKDNSAIELNKENHAIQIKQTEEFIIKRIKEINEKLGESASFDDVLIKEEIKDSIQRWLNIIEECNEDNLKFYFGYTFIWGSSKLDENTERRLMKPFLSTKPSFDNSKETMTSMRNVEGTVEGRVVIWEDDI